MKTIDKKIKKLFNKYAIKITLKWVPKTGFISDFNEEDIKLLNENVNPLIYEAITNVSIINNELNKK